MNGIFPFPLYGLENEPENFMPLYHDPRFGPCACLFTSPGLALDTALCSHTATATPITIPTAAALLTYLVRFPTFVKVIIFNPGAQPPIRSALHDRVAVESAIPLCAASPRARVVLAE
jgi:hypothetical protein